MQIKVQHNCLNLKFIDLRALLNPVTIQYETQGIQQICFVSVEITAGDILQRQDVAVGQHKEFSFMVQVRLCVTFGCLSNSPPPLTNLIVARMSDMREWVYVIYCNIMYFSVFKRTAEFLTILILFCTYLQYNGFLQMDWTDSGPSLLQGYTIFKYYKNFDIAS